MITVSAGMIRRSRSTGRWHAGEQCCPKRIETIRYWPTCRGFSGMSRRFCGLRTLRADHPPLEQLDCEPESAMRVLVTGGAGFIGSAVCRLLVGERSATVLNIDKLTYAANLASLRTIESNPRYIFRPSRHLRSADDIPAAASDFDPDAVLTLPRNRMSTARSTARPNSSGPMSRARMSVGGGARPLAAAPPARGRGFAFITSRPTRFSARSARPANSPKRPGTSRIRPIRHRRRPPIIWSAPGTRPLACRSCSAIAPTITGPIISPKS